VHELSVCQALLIQVADIVRAQSAEAVERITIEVGPLSGTEPELLRSAFLVMRSGAAATAALVIEHSAVQISCLDCGANRQVPTKRLICSNCNGWRTRVIAGDGLCLLRVEMRMPESIDRNPYSNAETVHHV
jgi:hydrogenase nickel incorporation protein HypA/HybF